MEFDKNRVYTALNADEVKVGSLVICADDMDALQRRVKQRDGFIYKLEKVLSKEVPSRFQCRLFGIFKFCYFVSEPKTRELKWTDLKIGDIVRNISDPSVICLITGFVDSTTRHTHIQIGGSWIPDEALENWEKVEE